MAVRAGFASFAAIWVIAVGAGFAGLGYYSYTPGSEGDAAIAWPARAGWRPHLGRPTLVLFLHPYCPCSRATLGELDRLAAQLNGQADLNALFFRPQDQAPGWEQTDLWRRAKAIPGLRVQTDPGGDQTRLFGAETSGMALLYLDGRLRFRGGITAARGHEGDNAGRDAILSLIRSDSAQADQTVKQPGFGCSLITPVAREIQLEAWDK